MKLFTLTAAILMIISPVSLLSQTTYVDNGTSNSYTLQNNDSLYIKQGTFTGTITNWSGGGKVTVAAGATLKPNAINGFRGKYVVYGTAVFSSLNSEAGFGLNNYGSITIDGGSQINGNSSQVWTNNIGATLTIKGSFTVNSNAANSSLNNYGTLSIENSVAINSRYTTLFNSGTLTISSLAINSNANNSSITNNGEITIAADFNLYGDVTFQNNKSIVMGGNFSANKGSVNNGGLFSTSGTLTLGGNVAYTNTCRTVAENGIKIDNSTATVYNSGLLWASFRKNASSFTNSGTYTSSDQGILKTGTFINYGTIKGNGSLYITGKSTLGSQGKVGANGNTQDAFKIYIVNRTNASQIFDEQWGTVYSNSKYAQLQAPDTTTASYYPCSDQYVAPRILPVVWNDFAVSLSANIPSLSWAATYDAGTYFEVERSNNGVDFLSIAKIAGQQNAATYKYDDRALPSSHASVVYYRIKATEPDGTHKYTDVKSVKFSTEGGQSLQAWPNPFSSHLNLNYKSTQKAALTIKIYNLNGQVQVVKTAVVNAGNNSIALAEASSLVKGIYIVKIAADNGVAVTTKIVKQ